MGSVAEPAKAGNWERIRRLRYGHVLKLIRFRYGANGVPDDEAGRSDFMELVWLASSAPADANKKVLHCIELYALWMEDDEKERFLEHVARTPTYEKAKTSQELGKKLLLSNAERERLKLYSIRPCDLTPEEFERQSRDRKKAARAARRRLDGVKIREKYLADRRNKPKPWLAEGISQRTWQRRCRAVASHMSRGQGPTIVSKAEPHRATEQAVNPKEGQREEVVSVEAVRALHSPEAESQSKEGSRAKGHDLASPRGELADIRAARTATLNSQWANRHSKKEVG